LLLVLVIESRKSLLAISGVGSGWVSDQNCSNFSKTVPIFQFGIFKLVMIGIMLESAVIA